MLNGLNQVDDLIKMPSKKMTAMIVIIIEEMIEEEIDMETETDMEAILTETEAMTEIEIEVTEIEIMIEIGKEKEKINQEEKGISLYYEIEEKRDRREIEER